MKDKYCAILAGACFSFISLLAAPLHALGIGGYGFASYNQKPGYYEALYPNEYGKNSSGALLSGGGLIIDTNCAKDTIFNYRLNIGAARSFILKNTLKPEQTTKISLLNTFGFGIARTESLRFWLGPQLGIHSLSGGYGNKSKDYINITIYNGTTYANLNYFALLDNKFKFSYLGVSIGFSIGMNINFTKPLTLSIEVGGRGYVYYGINSHKGYIYYNSLPFPIYRNSWLPSYKYDAYISLAILYRINDSFISKNSEIEVK